MRRQLLGDVAPYLLRRAPSQYYTRTIRVLYIEDEKAVQISVSKMLQILGYKVACADNGQQGFEKAKSWRPHIILMDMRMPVMDGLETTRRLRQEAQTAHIPIFILSAYTDIKTKTSCQQAGANGLLAKPVSIEKINTVIEQTIIGK